MKFFIAELFKSLEESNVRYAVLRNYESLPEKPADSDYFDLDLIVSSKDYERYRSVVHNVAAKHEASIIKEFSRSYVKHIRVVKLLESHYVAVQLDAHIKGQGWHGYYYLHENEILENRKKYNNIYVVSDFHKALINWLDKLLWGGYIKDKYRNDIQNIMKSHVKLLENFLAKVLPEKEKKDLSKIVTIGNLNDSVPFRGRLIAGIRRLSIKQYSLATFFWTADFYYRELILRIKPPGLKVIFKKDNSHSNKIFDDLKTIVLGESLYLTCQKYPSTSFKRIYTILRKQGLVAIISSRLVDNNYQAFEMCLSESNHRNEVIGHILSRYKKERLFGATVVYIAN
ncbi:hypothetical protein GCM10023116_47340 [Kistimonas scapharcae]|uniref:Uncharacterized protein n=1 Tax=Kistimonas scapharcae TaxID=1036133 RepID=A0ABP8VB29_9GAMM